MRRHLLFVLAALMGLASVAGAADIQVSYRVDAKLLKKGTPAGTPLTFQLYTDSICATSAGGPQNANVEAVALIEQPKLVKVKGGPTPPSVAEIRYTLTGITPEPTFYATVTGTGITPIGGACQLQTASVGGTIPPPLSCPPDSVLSGSLCVDKYEASVWIIPREAVTAIRHVKDGTVTLAELNTVGATLVSPAPSCAGLPTNSGDGTNPDSAYAVSIAGVLPTSCVNFYQSSDLCQFSGKRLLTNEEWFAAATGTPPGSVGDNGTTDCNTESTDSPANTGSRSSCVSTTGASDMVGNVYEWAASASDAGTQIRGGSWDGGSFASILNKITYPPGMSGNFIGFRCAR